MIEGTSLPPAKLRVGFDARWYNDSGVGTYVSGLLRTMAALQDEIELVVYENPRNPVPELHGAVAVRRLAVHAPKYSMAELFELRRRVREDGLDIFHTPFYRVPGRLACPAVVTVHDLIPFLFPIYPWPKQWMVRRGYRAAARRAGHIIAVSGNTAKDTQEILGIADDRLTVIPNAAAEDCFHSRICPGEVESFRETDVRPPYVVVASARNWRTKNLAGALHALELTRLQSGVRFQTVVYGPTEGLKAAGGEAAWPGLSLRCTGYVAPKKLAALFRHAHAFVMPSFYEGFGLPVVEAMACGCAVITSNAGSLAEVAGDGAQVFSPQDAAGMAGALSGLLLNREERDHWRAAALRRAADFSWHKAARETISVYHRTRAAFWRGRQNNKSY